MRPTQHGSNNRVLGAPKGWEQEHGTCSALAVTDRTTTQGPSLESYWRPSSAELTALNSGALVILSVMGSNMPPVALAVEGVIE